MVFKDGQDGFNIIQKRFNQTPKSQLLFTRLFQVRYYSSHFRRVFSGETINYLTGKTIYVTLWKNAFYW